MKVSKYYNRDDENDAAEQLINSKRKKNEKKQSTFSESLKKVEEVAEYQYRSPQQHNNSNFVNTAI